MLILTRRMEEEIYIETPEGRITLKVINLDPRSVKLGIDAPKEFTIYREELYRQVNKENKESIANKESAGKIFDLFSKYKQDD